MIPSQLFFLSNHLWQSTLFAIAAGFTTWFLRANRAQVRYWIWLVASVKFLVPFSIFVAVGAVVGQRSAGTPSPSTFMPASNLSIVVGQVGSTFTNPLSQLPVTTIGQSYAHEITAIILIVWAMGFLTLIYRWAQSWRRLRSSMHEASPVDLRIELPAKSSRAFGEPGVFGIIRPVLLLPDGIVESLTALELEAIVEHELCHVRGHDNLVTAIHMAVEAIFWFHPLVWWLGARLMEERERACDEEVIRNGVEPRIYAEGILKVCESYFVTPHTFAAGVSGGNLKKRIEAIMSDRMPLGLNYRRKAALLVAALVTLGLPVTVGIIHVPSAHAQVADEQITPGAKFEVASIKPTRRTDQAPNGFDRNLFMAIADSSRHGRFSMPGVPLSVLIQIAYNVQESQISGGDLWTNSDRYKVDAKTDSNATLHQMRPMLRSLLADRFSLRLHREKRDAPVYELAVPKSGLKIEPARPGDCFTVDPDHPSIKPLKPNDPLPHICGGTWRTLVEVPNRVAIDAFAISMPKFVELISADVGRIIVDNTGFTENFDVHLEFRSEGMGNRSASGEPGMAALSDNPSASGVSIFTAVQQQLGLHLRSTKLPVEVLVIDHVERPSEN